MPREPFGSSPPAVQLYPFRFRDRLTGKWVCARNEADLDVIAAQYLDWALTRPPEALYVGDESFSPWQGPIAAGRPIVLSW